MTYPPAILDALALLIHESQQSLAAQLAAKLADRAAACQLLSYRDAAKLLCVSEGTARRLLPTHTELGEATKRVSLAQVERLIQDRTFSHGCAVKTAGGGRDRANVVNITTGVETAKATASGNQFSQPAAGVTSPHKTQSTAEARM